MFVRILDKFISICESKSFLTYHKRPKKMSTFKYEIKAKKNSTNEKTCILIQGPIVKKSHFTIETALYYQNIYKNSLIIISTYPEYLSYLNRHLQHPNIKVITSRKIEDHGPSNINLQALTTNAGIQYADICKKDYILKTRADQRFYNPETLNILHNLTEIFKVEGNKANQKERIIFASQNSFESRVYGPTDTFVFGHISDIKRYFDIQRVNSNSKFKSRQKNDLAKNFLPEVYFFSNYLLKTGHKLEWGLSDYQKVMRERIIFVDSSEIDLFWPKYGKKEFRWKRYEDVKNFQEISFNSWLLNYCQSSTFSRSVINE